MKFLLDTHLMLWSMTDSERLSRKARELLDDKQHDLVFSATSIWEVAIKRDLDGPGFLVEPSLLRQHLLNDGYKELELKSTHAMALRGMPKIHCDPFDRILIAQAMVEGFTLLTVDAKMAKYPGPIRLV